MLENTEEAIKKDNPEKLPTQGTQDTGEINVREYRRDNAKGQSRETGNKGYTRHRTNKCQRIPKGQEKGQSRETGNIGYTRHRTNKCQRIPKGQSKIDNPDKLATQGTQDTG